MRCVVDVDVFVFVAEITKRETREEPPLPNMVSVYGPTIIRRTSLCQLTGYGNSKTNPYLIGKPRQQQTKKRRFGPVSCSPERAIIIE